MGILTPLASFFVLRVTLAIMLVNLVNVTELREISKGHFHMYLSSCFQNQLDHEGSELH